MKTEYRLASALKELMSDNKPLSEISVTMLTKKCKVGRQTFYYHFHDVYDLLTMVFLNEEIKKVKDSHNLDDILTSIYAYYEKNASFISSVLSSGGRDLFLEFINNNVYQTLLRLTLLSDKEKITTLTERRNISRFYAAAISQTITFYFENVKKKSIAGLKKYFSMLHKDFLINAIKSTVKNRVIV